jgi:beta-lactamase class A
MSLLKRKEEKSLRDLKKNRQTILVVIGVTLLAILGVVSCREREKVFRGIFKPQTIVSTIVSRPSPPLTLKPSPTPGFTKEVEEIKELIDGLKGRYGVYVQDLTTGESYGVNSGEIFPAASLNKLPVLLTLYQEAEAGRLSLETKYSLKQEDKRGGAGSLQYKPAGTVYTYRKMAELMGRESDNTAFYVFSRLLGGDKIQKTINDLGMRRTSFKDFETSPEDLGIFFSKLYNGGLLTKTNQEELFSFLTNSWWEDRIPTGVPKGIKVVHKVGTEIGVVADAGVVFAQKPFVLVILSEKILESEAKEILPKIAELVYRQRVK